MLLGRAALLIGLAAGPGCAGDDGLSRTDFRARADSICASANDEIRALGPEPPILTDEQAAWVEGVGAVGRAAVDEIGGLARPEGDGERLDVMIAGFERGFAGADDIARASRAGDDAAFRAAAADAIRSLNDARFAAAEYGLDACARLGRP